MTTEEEHQLIEACARAMGYEVHHYERFGWTRYEKIGGLNLRQVLWNPLTRPDDCAEMEDAKDVDITRCRDRVVALPQAGGAFFTEFYPENPTLEQKSAARRLAVCRCVAASVEKEK